MRQDASVLNGPFAACYTLKNPDPVLLNLETTDINKISCWFAMLCYQNG